MFRPSRLSPDRLHGPSVDRTRPPHAHRHPLCACGVRDLGPRRAGPFQAPRRRSGARGAGAAHRLVGAVRARHHRGAPALAAAPRGAARPPAARDAGDLGRPRRRQLARLHLGGQQRPARRGEPRLFHQPARQRRARHRLPRREAAAAAGRGLRLGERRRPGADGRGRHGAVDRARARDQLRLLRADPQDRAGRPADRVLRRVASCSCPSRLAMSPP